MAGHAPGNIGITPEADSRFVPQIYPFTMAGLAGLVCNRSSARIIGKHGGMGRFYAGV